MNTLIKISIIIHVTAGLGALLFGAIAFALRKNTPKHKPVGKIYFWCMTIIFVTGIFLSIAKGLLFFFFIAVFTYYSTLVAYRSLRLTNLHKDQKPLKLDWLIEITAGITFFGLIILAIVSFLRQNNPEAIVPFVFGCLGLSGTYNNFKRFFRKPKETNYWLKIHAGNMMGSYIGAITAFLVNQAGNIPVPPILLWLGPALILVPVMSFELKKIQSEPIGTEA